MTLQDIFKLKKSKNYLSSHLNEEFKDSFILLREKSLSIRKEDEIFILELLKNDNTKWFVASYLQTVEFFNECILDKIIEAGVNTIDPSFNRFFIKPCVRIFGTIKVLESLEKIYYRDNLKADNILSVIYHIHSQFLTVGKFKSFNCFDWQTVGFKYHWREEFGEYHLFSRDKKHQFSKREMMEYEPKNLKFKAKRKRLIMIIKSNTKRESTIKLADRLLRDE